MFMFQAFARKHKKDIAIAIVLFFVALLPRVLDLGIFLTADEKNWMGRSFEFIRAFQDLRFNDMLQTTHPGVTTLWVSGLAILAKSIGSDVQFANTNLIYFVKISQFSIALLNAFAIPAIYIFLRVLFRKQLLFPLLASLLIALDPFIIGYSRVVHVDALMGSFLTLAVLSSMIYAKRFSRPWLIASAVFGTLAMLTKFPAVFIMPFIVTALVVYNPRRVFQVGFLKNRAREAILWLLLGILMICILWPAVLWVPNPAGNALQLKRDISTAALTPHDSNEDYSLKPLHYPYALLDRSTPLTLFGAILGVVGIVHFATNGKLPKNALLIVVYLVGFVVMMTLGAKKGDRYIVPAFFAFDMLAAYGILYVVSNLSRFTVRRMAVYFVVLLSGLYSVSVIVSYHPYALAYNNPLFPENLSQELGWGEGLDLVADWLNEYHPNAIVASWYPEELGAFTKGKVLHINAHAQNPVEYIVLYKNMFGRAPDHYANDFIDEYFKKREPIHTVYVAGHEYAWIYEKPSYSKTIGDLDDNTIAIQEIVADYENLAGIDLLAATRFGQADTGTLVVAVSKTITDAPLFTEQIPVSDIKDGVWYSVDFPKGVSIEKGQHLFVSIRAVGSSAPYASIRYAPVAVRQTPIYISRTGNMQDASKKQGSLSVRLNYVGIDGQIRTELETKLLK